MGKELFRETGIGAMTEASLRAEESLIAAHTAYLSISDGERPEQVIHLSHEKTVELRDTLDAILGEELADEGEPEPMPEKYYLQLVPENDCSFINSMVHDGEIHIDDSEQTDYFQTQFTMEEIDSDPALSRYKSFAVKVPAGEWQSKHKLK